MDIPTELLIADPHINTALQGNLLQDYEHKFEQLPEDQKLYELKNLSREYAFPRNEEASRVRVDSWKHEDRPGLGREGLRSSRTLRY